MMQPTWAAEAASAGRLKLRCCGCRGVCCLHMKVLMRDTLWPGVVQTYPPVGET